MVDDVSAMQLLSTLLRPPNFQDYRFTGISDDDLAHGRTFKQDSEMVRS